MVELRVCLDTVKISKLQSVTGVLEYDPELRFTPGGHAVATFTLISHETGEKTSCEMWRDMAENFIEEFFAGQRMSVMTVWGKMSKREWTDRNDEKRETETFTVSRYEFQFPDHVAADDPGKSLGTCGVCDTLHNKCSRQDWHKELAF